MSAEQCAQRVMALLEMNEFKGGDEEQSSGSLGILQKEMGFLMQCLAVHPRVLENLDAAQNACSIAKVLCNSTREASVSYQVWDSLRLLELDIGAELLENRGWLTRLDELRAMTRRRLIVQRAPRIWAVVSGQELKALTSDVACT